MQATRTAGIAIALLAVSIAGCAPLPTPTPSPTPPAGGDFEPAGWALDPAFPSPTADATVLHVLAYERFCASGRPAFGRMSAPEIEYAPQTVTITIKVRRLSGPQECPSNPGTPAIVRLAEPLGDRTLVDGGGPIGAG